MGLSKHLQRRSYLSPPDQPFLPKKSFSFFLRCSALSTTIIPYTPKAIPHVLAFSNEYDVPMSHAAADDQHRPCKRAGPRCYQWSSCLSSEWRLYMQMLHYFIRRQFEKTGTKNMLGKAPSLGCANNDINCLCSNFDFGKGVRDSNELCPSTGATDTSSIIAVGNSFCSG
jgi:hypothetical protein